MSVHTNLITCNNYEISQNRIEISAFVLSIVTRNTFTTPLYMKYTKYSACTYSACTYMHGVDVFVTKKNPRTYHNYEIIVVNIPGTSI